MIDVVTVAIVGAVVSLLVIAGTGRAPTMDAAPPPPDGFSLGAAGSGRNGTGGSIAPSPTMRSWPGTGVAGNGGPFAFIGAHYGSTWQVPATANNSAGVGYCVMEDIDGEGAVSLQHDPVVWDTGEMARAAALMSSFGGDRVVPYGIDAAGTYDVASGEWQLPALVGGGEYTRRRHVAVNFGVKMLVEDVSPTGAVAGLKLARDTTVVSGSGGEFSALRHGYEVAQRLVGVAEAQHAVGGVRLEMIWATSDGHPPTRSGTHPLQVRAVDATGKPVGFVPVVTLSDIGIDGARTVDAIARVDRVGHSPDEAARWAAAEALGWPTMDMAGAMAADRRFGLGANPLGADITDASGFARFEVTVTDADWALAFHTQAPTADVSLYAGTGIQGQITWSGPPQSASIHLAVTPPQPPPPPPPPPVPPSVPPPSSSTDPVVGAFAVRKVLDAADVQGTRDMAGFEFEVTTDDGIPAGRLTTGADGLTSRLEASSDTYTITEVARPAWSAGLGDGGPITFEFEPDGDDELEISYANIVPDASITTAARDSTDGDQWVDLAAGDAAIIDTVDYRSLVPGTEYSATGELMVVIGSETVASGITASTVFVPGEPDGSVEVTFTVPRGWPLPGHLVVVYQQLSIASSGRVVATHTDPAAAEQTIRFTDVIAATTTIAAPSTVPATAPEKPSEPPPTSIPAAASTVPSTSPAPASPPATTSTSAPSSSTTSPSSMPPSAGPQLPRTGVDGSQSLAVASVAIMLFGAGLLLAARAPGRRPDVEPDPRP